MNLNELLSAVVIVAFANCSVIEAIHHGEVFARLRAWFETKEGFLPSLLLCPFCLSYWPPTVLLLLLLWHELYGYQFLALIPLSFAVTRMSNLLNDGLHNWCRTPRVTKELQNEIANLDILTQGGSDGPITDGGSAGTE